MEFELDIATEDWHIVAARTDAFDRPGSFGEGLACVSEHRRAKALGYRFEKDRRLSLLAGLLLDELLGGYGLRERDMRYAEGEHGKPSFTGWGDLHFSLAHSGEVAVAALSGRPVGVDVEQLPGFPRDIADPCEWTALEAVAKLLGCGMAPFVDGRPCVIPEGVRVEHLHLGDHLVSVAWESAALLSAQDTDVTGDWTTCHIQGNDPSFSVGRRSP